jgi:hypothetical protein
MTDYKRIEPRNTIMAKQIFRKLVGVETKDGIVHEVLECGHVLRYTEREYGGRRWSTKRRCWTCIYVLGRQPSTADKKKSSDH